MRYLKRALSALIVLLVALAALSGLTMAQSGEGQVRFVHALPGAAAVDIYINNLPTVRGLDFGQATQYISVPASENTITVTEADGTTPLWQQTYSPVAGSASTMVVSSSSPLEFTTFPDDISPIPLGRARITAIHALSGGPAVDVVLEDGRAVVAGLNYNTPYGTLDIPALVYPLAVVPSGSALTDAIIPVTPFALNSGTSYIIVVYGTPANPQALVLSAPVAPEAAGGNIRVVHGVLGGPDVDVYLNETLVIPSLSAEQASGYIAVPAGSYTAAVRAAGTSEDIASADLTVAEDDFLTIAAIPDDAGVGLVSFTDQPTLADAQAGAVALYNASASSAEIALETSDGNATDTTLAAPAGTAAVDVVQPNALGLVTGADAGGITLAEPVVYGGNYYGILAIEGTAGPEFVRLPEVAFAQAPGSAPGSLLAASTPEQVAVLATPTVLPMVEVTGAAQVAVQSTATPLVVVVTATPPAALAPATADPNIAIGTLTPAAAQATPLPAGPTGRILLDPGANLQLRQYPNRDAFSLGLAPAGSILIINGRQGAPEFNVPGVPTPTPDPLVTPAPDPATLLGPDEDLSPLDTWLNVSYVTPDGGVIDAWVNAQFIDVRDVRGRRQRLADLPTIPQNRPGEARDTAVTPPTAVPDIVVATVFNLDEGANLQIRRTPNSSSESLALVPNGTAMELVGLLETRDWAFVRYAAPQGGEVNGWASTIFLEYSFRNQPQTIDELLERERVEFIPGDRRGVISAGVTAPAGSTPNPLEDVVVGLVTLDEGANLHLRRTPNSNSESLALLPSQTQIVVTGRTDTREWLQVEFEDQEGWIFSQYVSLTFNGEPYNLEDLPITLALQPPVLPTVILATATPG